MIGLGALFELHLLAALPRYFRVLQILGVRLPVILGLSLVGTAGYSMEIPALVASSHAQGGRIGSDRLFLPEVVAADFAQDPGELLRPTFDAIWESAGRVALLSRLSMVWDGEGIWIGPRSSPRRDVGVLHLLLESFSSECTIFL